MYKQSDLDDISAQLWRRISLWALPQLPLLAALIYTLIIRNQALTIATFVLMGWLAIFAAGGLHSSCGLIPKIPEGSARWPQTGNERRIQGL